MSRKNSGGGQKCCYTLLNLGAKCEWSTSRSGRLIPTKGPTYPLKSRLVGPQSWSGCTVEEINLFSLPRSKSWFLGYSACSIGTVTPRHRWKENVETDRKAVCQGDWILLALDRNAWKAVVNMVVSFWVLKCACEHCGGCEPLDAIQGRELVN